MTAVDEEAIDALPETWISDKAASRSPEGAKRYADAVERLSSLNEQRRELRRRVERLRRIKATIDPLQTEPGGAGVQENLVTRNGDVEKELERMRMLLVRVAGRVGTLPSHGRGEADNDDDVKPIAVQRKRDVDEFLSDSKVFPAGKTPT